MRNRWIHLTGGHLAVVALIFCAGVECPAASAAGPFPRLLPAAKDFRLILREDLHSKLPLDPSCGGKASLTLTCHAFTLTLKNLSARTIHISGIRCQEPAITLSRKEPRSSTGWWPISDPRPRTCKDIAYTDVRLKPGQHMEYQTRLISDRRDGDAFAPGSYVLRAEWTLFGCTDTVSKYDCLTPLQVIGKTSTVGNVNLQEPVVITSNEVTVESPRLSNLGNLKFAFDVTIAEAGALGVKSILPAACAGRTPGSSINCTLFHYSIRNLSDRPVLNATASCSNSGITPEYRFSDGDWKPVPGLEWVCSMNVVIETKILPGGTAEGNFTLASLAPGYDAGSLNSPGDYHFRFTFWSNACFASPDGRFCLMRPEKQTPVVSREIMLSVKSQTTPAN